MPLCLTVKCCQKLNVKLFANAHKTQGKWSGNYTINSKKLNDRYYWKRDDNTATLSFDEKKDRWTISSSIGAEGGIFAPFGNLCPSRIENNWQYHDIPFYWPDKVEFHHICFLRQCALYFPQDISQLQDGHVE